MKVYKTVKKVRDIFDEEGNRLYDSALYHQVTTPKSEKSYRIVPLSDIAVKALNNGKPSKMQTRSSTDAIGDVRIPCLNNIRILFVLLDRAIHLIAVGLIEYAMTFKRQ